MSEKILLSIIVPAHNEQNRLPASLPSIADYMEKQPYPWEVIIVVNGSTDDTLGIAQNFSKEKSNFKVMELKENGKGRAVKHGMLAAKGKWRFMCDADLSMPINELDLFITPNLKNQQILIASREAEGSVRHNEPNQRHWGGRLLNGIIQFFTLPSLKDTQCGFKLFKGTVAEDLFSVQTVMGWAFDIEILYIARMRKYKVEEIPINWHYRSASHINPIKDALKIIVDIFEIKSNAQSGIYEKKI
jgi:dolichyl-phosphate beta-glucosyltransferase